MKAKLVIITGRNLSSAAVMAEALISFPKSSLLDGKRDDQNADFRGESDERHEPDLGVYIEA